MSALPKSCFWLDAFRGVINEQEKKVIYTPMPCFLVTHTSIIETDDEQGAAKRAIGEIRIGQQFRSAACWWPRKRWQSMTVGTMAPIPASLGTLRLPNDRQPS
jgi:hypothetical protein